jgi:membrane dipeptidase
MGDAAPHRASCLTVDLHCDLLWRAERTGKDCWSDCPDEMLDLPRMAAFGPSIQCFTLYTPADRTGVDATAYARGLLDLWRGLVERGAGRLGWVRTPEELDAAPADGLSGILTMEGASPLRGEIDLLEEFVEDGLRSLGLTHNPRNEAGDGCTVPDGERRGLTAFGRALVRRCVELGVLLDVAHLAPEGFRDLMDELAGLDDPPPVVSTHTGCRALTDHPRNLADDQLRELAATGGLVGVTLYAGHLALPGRETSLANVLEHLEHAASVCGADHVAIGADLDGFDPPGMPGGVNTPACYRLIEEGLLGRGWSLEDVAKAMGGNALRVLRRTLPST